MDLSKKFKAKGIRRAILPVCLLLVGAVLLIAVSEFWLFLQKPADLYDVPRDELEGKVVTVEVPYIYACYAYTEQYKNDRPTGVITSSEYIIDANTYDYCGLLLPKSMVELGDALLEESDAYYYYETDEITKTFTVKGVMEKMPEDSLEFYYETVGWDDMSAADRDIFLPLYLSAWDSGSVVSMVILLVLGLACLAAAVVILVKAVSGKNQKQFLQKAKELSPGNPDYILAHASELYKNAPSVGGLRMNASLILIEQGSKLFLYATKDLLWAYQNVVQHKTNGIPTHKSYHLMLNMSDGATRDIAMAEEQVQEQLQKIFALVPTCAMGFSEEMRAMFKGNRAALAEIAKTQRTPAAPAEAPAAQAEAPQEPVV